MSFTLHDLAPAQESFAQALTAGLSAPDKSIPARFLYDAQGSTLFERITELPEYYPTRTEVSILRADAGAMAAVLGPDVAVVEFGAGSSRKARFLLDALERPAAYAPIDVSTTALTALAEEVAHAYPALAIEAVCADYGQDFELPALPGRRRVGFFPGGTIGNLTPQEAEGFLAAWAPRLGPAGAMLVGVDLRKPVQVVLPAYDDSQGVTARFTLNILARANRELDADFELAAFAHRVDYDPSTGRVAIYLESLRPQAARAAGRSFSFAAGERIHVEDSWKYAAEDFQALARRAGYEPVQVWTDPDELFSVHLMAAGG